MTYKEIDKNIALPIEIDPIDRAAYEAVQRLIMDNQFRHHEWGELPDETRERLFNSLKVNLAEFVFNVQGWGGVTK